MKPGISKTIRLAVILAPAAVVCVAFLIAVDAHTLPSDGLTVHEWGTFTSVAGEDGAAVEWDALGCKNDLPSFVNDYGYRGFKWRLQGTVRMETPVLYFYSSRELDARVKVAFPQGVITEWYPKAENQVYRKSGADGSLQPVPANLNGIDTSLRTLTGAIEWKNVKIQPRATPILPVGGPSRYYAARQTDATPLAVDDQEEKFLFYRGVGRFPVPLSVRVAGDGKVLVENRGKESVASVILFENRQGRIGHRTLIGAGDSEGESHLEDGKWGDAVEGSVTLDLPTLDGSLPQLRHVLETLLIGHGLFPKEAHAMVETWQDSWFEEGSRLIYIVPSAAVDTILPLQVTPTPSRTVRVFVGRIELVTPATTQFVESAVAKGDWAAVDRYSRFLDPILERMYPGNPDKVSGIEQRFQNLQGFLKAGCGAGTSQSVTQGPSGR
jgi:hypothetical protein